MLQADWLRTDRPDLVIDMQWSLFSGVNPDNISADICCDRSPDADGFRGAERLGSHLNVDPIRLQSDEFANRLKILAQPIQRPKVNVASGLCHGWRLRRRLSCHRWPW